MNSQYPSPPSIRHSSASTALRLAHSCKQITLALALTLSACLLSTAGSTSAAVVAGPGHMDIDMNINAAGEWSFSLSHDGAGSGFEAGGTGGFTRPADTSTVIYIPRDRSFSRPASSAWSFLGVGSGESVWIFPQVQDDAFVWPGLNTEATAPSSIDSWLPSHPLLSVAGQYMELRLTGMQYYGEGTQNHFSLWVSGTFGTPNAWMSTANGISGTDAFFMFPGGHSHMNWGFTSEGIYDLTFQARTMQGGELMVSDPFTLRFGVGTTDAVPEPSRALLLAAGLACLFLRRQRSGRTLHRRQPSSLA